jgi:hypothetical protein
MTTSLIDRSGHKTNIKKKLISIATIVLWVVKPTTTTIEYITANATVSHNIEIKNVGSQYPDLAESISHIEPSRNTMLKKTNNTAPVNFEISIAGLEMGFEISKSMVPFSSIDGIKEAVEISEKKIIRFHDMAKKPVSTCWTNVFESVRLITPSTESIFTRKSITSTTIA